MSLSVQQLLSDARRLSARLREHDSAAESVISNSQELLKGVQAMKDYQEDVEQLNSVAHNRPRAQLVLGIQQENRHIRQLQHENKELRAALEESQNAVELIMSKYRQHMSYLVNTTKLDKNLVNYQRAKMLQEKTDQICEMASVMQTSIQMDEAAAARDQEVRARLVTENRGLREMLEISRRSGTSARPIVPPKLVSTECQTDEVDVGDSRHNFSSPSLLSSSSPANKFGHATSPASSSSASSNASSHLPPSPLSRTSAVSPSQPARPESSASSRASDASSSPTTSVILSANWREDDDVMVSPSNGDSAVGASSVHRQPPGSESDSDEEITFNTIKRGKTVSPARVPPTDADSAAAPVQKLNGTNGHHGVVVGSKKCNIDREDDEEETALVNGEASEDGGGGGLGGEEEGDRTILDESNVADDEDGDRDKASTTALPPPPTPPSADLTTS